tara:strand:+ start:262 stop:513 length:252 start_codon:yes stop_codon:yes gene_type:complete
MQIKNYAVDVAEAIESFADCIKNCVQDSIAENADYAVQDSLDSIDFLFSNYAQHTSAESLASAALDSTLDTVVRENIYASLVG